MKQARSHRRSKSGRWARLQGELKESTGMRTSLCGIQVVSGGLLGR